MQFKHMLLGLAVLCFTATKAQQMPTVPVDKQVRIGHLENGLTYYIRANKLPENRANFYIVQRVGSILEEENQRGLAHFLEHMAFHGSKHFPEDQTGSGIISYLETIGVKFGRNLNAYTGMDETVYNIDDVPTDRRGAVDSCLLILHDWSNSLFLRDKDIDKERKVIHEEWRTRRSASSRLIDSIAPVIFAGSKYAERMPIGLMSVVDHFKPKELRDYYHKWYRPDLQAIIIVGDFDAEQVEKDVKRIFGSIPKPVNPAERVYEKIPDNEAPAVAVVTDKEQPTGYFMVSYKRDALPKEQKMVIDYLVYDFATDMIDRMLTDRFQEMMQNQNPPFAYARASNGSFFGVATTDAMQLAGVIKPGQADTTLLTLLREAKRVHDFGFTPSEYERAKADWLSDIEKLYNERDKQKNNYYVQQYVEHFLLGEPIPSLEEYYQIMSQVVPSVPLEAINQLAAEFISDNNRAVVLMGNEEQRPTYPTPDRIRKIIAQVDGEHLTAYADKSINEPLIATLPNKGKITKEEKLTDRGVTVWTLSNGARVAVKKTDFKKDEILLAGFAYGGKSLMDPRYAAEQKLMDDASSVGGLGKFSATDLKKVLAGKNADVSASISEYNQSVGGRSSVKDLETLMQLLYLQFTAVRKDETAYAALATRLKGILPMLANNPDYAFNDSVMMAIYKGNLLMRIPTVKEIDAVNYDKLLDLFRARLANAADYTFTFVGNVDESALRPLVEQYVASLPSNGKPSKAFNKDYLPVRKGQFENHFSRQLETEKATTSIYYSGDMAYTADNLIRLSALEQLFNMEFVDKIREKLGGTYGVSVSSNAQKLPTEGFSLQFQYDCAPDRRVELTNAMNQVSERMRKTGPDAVMLSKVKEYMLKQHADNLKENGYTLRATWRYLVFGIDINADYEKKVNALTIESVRDFANQLLSQGNRIEVSMSSK